MKVRGSSDVSSIQLSKTYGEKRHPHFLSCGLQDRPVKTGPKIDEVSLVLTKLILNTAPIENLDKLDARFDINPFLKQIGP